MDFLQLKNKNILIFGVANRKSIAYKTAQVLENSGANIIYFVRSQKRKDELNQKLLKDKSIYVCDVESSADIINIKKIVQELNIKIDGIVHSIAFANYQKGFVPFHEIEKKDFLQATDISCYSLINIIKQISNELNPEASIVTISISTTRMASQNYGYMAPIKAALNSTAVFLARSLSNLYPKIRVNAVGASLLKTSSSAGIPNYVKNYLYAEKVIPRKKALTTEEVANTISFLLSPSSSGINAQTIVVDAGMDINFFDPEIIDKF